VGYLRVSEYLLRGDFRNLLSVYWGPLISWVTAPLLLLGLLPWEAVRFSLTGFALLYTFQVFRLLHSLAPGSVAVPLFTVAAALTSSAWAARDVAADLPMAACACGLYLALLEAPLGASAHSSWRVGLWGALLWLSKPIGVPLVLCLLVSTALLRAVLNGGSWRDPLRAGTWNLLALGILVSPWVLAISVHYGGFTLTRSIGVSRAVTHPSVTHLWSSPSVTEVHLPPPGRITTWEDPSLDSLEHLQWSPVDSREMAVHQLALTRRSAGRFLAAVRDMDGGGVAGVLLFLLPLALLVTGQARVCWREVWLPLPVVWTFLAYLPFFTEARYLLHLHALIYAVLAVTAVHLQEFFRAVFELQPGKARGMGLIAGGLLLLPPMLSSLCPLQDLLAEAPRQEMRLAGRLAQRLRKAGIVGPVVSWVPYPEKGFNPEGIYLAWVLEQPWLGHLASDGKNLGEAEKLGARILLVKDRSWKRSPPDWVRKHGGWRLLGEGKLCHALLRGGRFFLLVRDPVVLGAEVKNAAGA
jgi:hypothetical protein